MADPAPTNIPLHGQKPLRGSERVSLSPIHEGLFGRMFRRLSPMPPLPDDVLGPLAQQMLDEETLQGGTGRSRLGTIQISPPGTPTSASS